MSGLKNHGSPGTFLSYPEIRHSKYYNQRKHTIQEVLTEVLTGDTIFLLDGVDRALMIASRGWEDRSVSEPITEGVVRGPRDGFTETLRTNTGLLRRRIKSPDLRLQLVKMLVLLFLTLVRKPKHNKPAKNETMPTK